jgi:glycosyltransferase involved in cell wall biosynthesis
MNEPSPSKPERTPAVGYIVSTWPRLSQTFVLNEVLALEQRGQRLRIFSVKDPGGEPVHADVARVRAKVTYVSVGARRKEVLRANLRLAREHPRRYCATLLQAARFRSSGTLRRFLQAGYLANVLDQEPVGHLHAHFATGPALVAMFAHKLRGIPYSFTAHARDIYVDTRPEVLRAEIQHAAAVVTVSEYNRRHLLDQFNVSPNGKLRCIYNGIDLSRFQFRWPRASDPGPPAILSVSRLVEKKGLADLIESANILRQWGRRFQVEIIGEGPLREALQARVRQLCLETRVKLAGPQPQELVRLAYLRASILALPCMIGTDGDRDGIPTVLLEAMASGLPVVSTPVSGIPELIETGRDGLLVPAKNPVTLAHALGRLLDDAALRDRLALAARAKIQERFTIDRSTEQLMALFQNGGCR